MSITSARAASTPAAPASRPPAWLIVCTGALAVTILMLAVAETDLRAQYLIDEGEFISLFGLGFILLAGSYVYRSGRLFVSLPLVLPWLLYPIITQGDQIIDNLSINPMRVICHVLLAAIFATPVAVVVMATSYVSSRTSGRRLSRAAASRVAALLFAAELWLASAFLGLLMMITVAVMIAGALLYGLLPATSEDGGRRMRSERFALGVLVVGFIVSAVTYLGYKNQPGAYQGSPSFFMDPTQKDSQYRLDRITVPSRVAVTPASPDAVRDALTAYGRTLERLLAGYHLLDRNYTYDFHNALFVRHRPLVPNYRASGLAIVDEARRMRADADARASVARQSLTADDPLAALLDDLREYVAFSFARAALLESMSAQFEQTQAGLQHAAHLYEGEGKYLGIGLSDLMKKHHAVVDAPAVTAVTGDLATIARSIYDAYAHHIIGF
jgi:hypothetical protein